MSRGAMLFFFFFSLFFFFQYCIMRSYCLSESLKFEIFYGLGFLKVDIWHAKKGNFYLA